MNEKIISDLNELLEYGKIHDELIYRRTELERKLLNIVPIEDVRNEKIKLDYLFVFISFSFLTVVLREFLSFVITTYMNGWVTYGQWKRMKVKVPFTYNNYEINFLIPVILSAIIVFVFVRMINKKLIIKNIEKNESNAKNRNRIIKKNEEIKIHNSIIQEKINEIDNKIFEIKNLVSKKYSWFHLDYINSDAIEFFISMFENDKTMTINRAIIYYEKN